MGWIDLHGCCPTQTLGRTWLLWYFGCAPRCQPRWSQARLQETGDLPTFDGLLGLLEAPHVVVFQWCLWQPYGMYIRLRYQMTRLNHWISLMSQHFIVLPMGIIQLVRFCLAKRWCNSEENCIDLPSRQGRPVSLCEKCNFIGVCLPFPLNQTINCEPQIIFARKNIGICAHMCPAASSTTWKTYHMQFM